MYHYAYLLTFPDGKKYIGARSTNLRPELDTCYLGSGRALPKDRLDTRNVGKTILAVFPTREELMSYEKSLIVMNDCVASEDWLNLRTATFDRHGSVPWNKGLKGIPNTHSATFIERYCKGYRSPAQIEGAKSMREKLTGVKNPGKAHHGTDNASFKPWYYITPEGNYVEIRDRTKEEMAAEFGVTFRQLTHRFHHSNQHRRARYKTLKGYTFGNLPRPSEAAEE